MLDNSYILDTRKARETHNREDTIRIEKPTRKQVIDYLKENNFLEAKKVCIGLRYENKGVFTGSSYEIVITTGIKITPYKEGYLLRINADLEPLSNTRPVTNFDFYITDDDILQLSYHSWENKDKKFPYETLLNINNHNISIWY